MYMAYIQAELNRNLFRNPQNVIDSAQINKMPKTVSKILTKSKAMQVLKLCKLANKLRPYYWLRQFVFQSK